jgi:hypothetical protein
MAERTEVRVEIFDPPMCCAGGLCGPDIDDELLDINEATLRIGKEFDGRVSIQRYVLSQQPLKFMQNPTIKGLLEASGLEVLPVTCLDGQIWVQQRYPAFKELRAAIVARLAGTDAHTQEERA